MTELFAYQDGAVAERCESLAAEIRAEGLAATRCVARMGALLIEAKEELGHGSFGPWLRFQFGWSWATANNYMNTWRVIARWPTAANLDHSTLYLLTGKVPDDVKAEVIENGYDASTAREIIFERAAEDWQAEVRELALEDPGAAYHAIETALDTDLGGHASGLLAEMAGTFARLSDRSEAEILSEAGVGVEKRYRKGPVARMYLRENDHNARLVVYVGEDCQEPLDVAVFPRSGNAAQMAARSAVIATVVERFKPRTIDNANEAR